MLFGCLLRSRRLRYPWLTMRRRKYEIILLSSIFLMLLIWLRVINFSIGEPSEICTKIDVVYTWVNGSDPEFIKSAKLYNPNYDPARFDDKNELLYSLRSLEMYAQWVHRIYIVTNGQIPSWLNLDNDRITIVPHKLLSPLPEFLPTFSSSAIETFLHRIPELSQRFIYMNDDIFLGAPLYPEDLYTESEGVRIYQAWMVPDCAEDCPWTYIGDGACDRHCNIAKCQYDGGDCSDELDTGEGLANEQIEQLNKIHKKTKSTHRINDTNIEDKAKFPLTNKFRLEGPIVGNSLNSTSFKDLMRHKNVSTLQELHRIVDSFNKRFRKKFQPTIFSGVATERPPGGHGGTPTTEYQSTKDIYSESLVYTNKLLNNYYGFKARNVPGHVGFLLDKDILNAIHDKFPLEMIKTASRRFRAANDIQFAFMYYSFVMSETRKLSVEEIFDEFDTDRSRTWSDREIRTFLTRMYPVPLDWSAVLFFEEVAKNCSRDLGFDKLTEKVVYSTLVYERYEDSYLPPITRELVAKCPLLAEALKSNFGTRLKYKYNINPKRNVHNNFMMLTSNLSEVVEGLDRMRREPRKFNCINDDLNPENGDDNLLIRTLLDDFYLSLFPSPSKFELPTNYRSRFGYWNDYQRFRRLKRIILVVGYCFSVFMIVIICRFICGHKAKIARRCVQKF